eukprot:TRINITY_DN19139_c0_g1_i1.p1 TRINITY_DN19139_c0_g1~~TRINITY_DN19139_c0_g1_i1.p1  ORF type:complete len:116 (-),score=9.12 TRINITY_DN19139_c0_g1_i1:55-402(-)
MGDESVERVRNKGLAPVDTECRARILSIARCSSSTHSTGVNSRSEDCGLPSSSSATPCGLLGAASLCAACAVSCATVLRSPATVRFRLSFSCTCLLFTSPRPRERIWSWMPAYVC